MSELVVDIGDVAGDKREKKEEKGRGNGNGNRRTYLTTKDNVDDLRKKLGELQQLIKEIVKENKKTPSVPVGNLSIDDGSKERIKVGVIAVYDIFIKIDKDLDSKWKQASVKTLKTVKTYYKCKEEHPILDADAFVMMVQVYINLLSMPKNNKLRLMFIKHHWEVESMFSHIYDLKGTKHKV